MKKEVRLVVLVLSSCILLLSSVSALNWPQSGHDIYNTGYQNEMVNLRGGFISEWSYTNGSEYFDTSPSIVGNVLYAGSNTSIDAFNLSTSGVAELLWSHADSYPVRSAPSVSNGVVYYGSNDGILRALNATTGTMLWNYSLNYSLGYNAPSVSGDVLYIAGKNGGGKGVLFAINLTTEKLEWQALDNNPNSAYNILGSPVVAEGDVYVPDANGVVNAYNASNGNDVWNYTLSAGYTYSPPCYANGVLYTPDGDNNVYALNASNGKQIWNYSGGYSGSNIEIDGCAVNNGVIYTQNYNGTIFAINASVGKEIWNFSSGMHVSYYAQAPTVSGDYVFILNSGREVYALNINNGTLVSYYPSIYIGTSISMPVISGNAIYFGTSNGIEGISSIYPEIQFVSPTPSDNSSIINETSLIVNVTSAIPALIGKIANITLNFYNSSGSLLGTKNSTNPSMEWNISFSKSGSYFLNATVNDSNGDSSSAAINFSVSLASPSVNIKKISPLDGYDAFIFYSNESGQGALNCSYTVYDSNGTVTGNPTNTFQCNSKAAALVPSFGTFNLSVSVEDSLGDFATSSKIFSVKSSPANSTSSSGSASGGSVSGCDTQWNCTAWSSCAWGMQSRTCTYPKGYCAPKSQIPNQIRSCVPKKLFDISMNLAKNSLNSSKDLISITSLQSFGTVPTRVNLTYDILNSENKSVYKSKGNITVQTEDNLIMNFTSLNLPPGKYVLVLTTIYGNNVTDNFSQAFQIQGRQTSGFILLFSEYRQVAGFFSLPDGPFSLGRVPLVADFEAGKIKFGGLSI